MIIIIISYDDVSFLCVVVCVRGVCAMVWVRAAPGLAKILIIVASFFFLFSGFGGDVCETR